MTTVHRQPPEIAPLSMSVTMVLRLVGVFVMMTGVISGSMMTNRSPSQPSATIVERVNVRCTRGDRRNIMDLWQSLSKMWAQGSRFRAESTRQTLLVLTRKHPELKDVFRPVDIDNPTGVNFTAHCWRISTAWDMLMNMLYNPRALDAALEHLADQHAARPGLKRQHFKTFAQMTVAGLRRGAVNFDFMAGESCITSLYDRIASKLAN
jgi:hypothetical protein